MLKIISVKGENFKSFKKFEFEIREGLWSIVGHNQDDSCSFSNGAGKTTLFCDSILWCLIGDTVEGLSSDDDIVNFVTKKDCLVEVVLNDGKQTVKITRTRKHTQFKNNLFLEIDGQSLSAHRVKDTQDRINQIIKVSPNILKSTIIMSADIANKFSSLTATDRVSLLESVRDYKIWADFRDKSKVGLDKYKNSIENLANENYRKDGSLQTIDNFIKKLEEDYTKEESANYSEDTLNQLIAELDTLNQKETNEKEIEKLFNEMTEKNNQAESIVLEHKKAVQSLNNLYSQSSKLDSDMQQYQNEINRYSNLLVSDSICPTCGQKVVLSEEKKNNILSQLSSYKKNYIEALKTKNELDEQIKNSSCVEPEGLNQLRQDVVDLQVKINNLKNEDKSLKDNILSLNTNINILKDNILSHNVRLKNIRENINQYKQQIEDIKKEIEVNSKQIDGFVIERDAYQFFYDSLGPRGNLRPYLLRKDVSYLNKALQYYAGRLYSGTTIRLTVPTVENNKIDIIVENSNGVVKPVSVLSRGERKRLDLCLQFSIYDLVKSTAMFDTNILILDEIFESLDIVGIQQVISILEERSENIPSIYVISHNPNAYELMTKQIVVTKTNDISKVDFKIKEEVKENV